jgi:hypothetical protein
LRGPHLRLKVVKTYDIYDLGNRRAGRARTTPGYGGNYALMTSDNGVEPPAETSGAAEYIASLAEELARLAKSYELEALAHILDMARLEAEEISKRWNREGPGNGGANGPD